MFTLESKMSKHMEEDILYNFDIDYYTYIFELCFNVEYNSYTYISVKKHKKTFIT